MNNWNICNYQEHFLSSHRSLDGDKGWCRKPDLVLTHSPCPELSGICWLLPLGPTGVSSTPEQCEISSVCFAKQRSPQSYNPTALVVSALITAGRREPGLWDHSVGDHPALITMRACAHNKALCPCQPLEKLFWTQEKHSKQGNMDLVMPLLQS